MIVKIRHLVVLMVFFFQYEVISQSANLFLTISDKDKAKVLNSKKENSSSHGSMFITTKSESISKVIDDGILGRLPLDSIIITSNYGMRTHPIKGVKKLHSGVDLRAKDNPVYAVQSGYISEIGYSSSLGSFVKLVCGNYEFVYGHLSHIYVSKGRVVNKANIIGRTGGTGDATAKHLHFAIKYKGSYLKPEDYLQFLGA